MFSRGVTIRTHETNTGDRKMDVTAMTLEELQHALTKTIESEDDLGHPDIHTEDFLSAEIARRLNPNHVGRI